MFVWVSVLCVVCVCVCWYEWMRVLCACVYVCMSEWVCCVCVCVCVCVFVYTYTLSYTTKKKQVQCHYDTYGYNLVAQLWGTKRWQLSKSQKKNSQKSPPYSDVVIQWIGLVWFLRIFLRCHFWLLRNLLICDVVQLMCLVLTFEGKKIQRLIPGAFSLLAQLLAPCCSPLVCRMRNFFSYFPSWLNCFFLMQPTRVQYEESKFSFYFPLLVKIILYGISYTFVK